MEKRFKGLGTGGWGLGARGWGISGTGVSPVVHKYKYYFELRYTGETPVPLCFDIVT